MPLSFKFPTKIKCICFYVQLYHRGLYFLKLGLHLALLVRQIQWWWNPSGVVYIVRSLYLLHFWRTVLRDIIFLVASFPFPFSTLNMSSYSLLTCSISADTSLDTNRSTLDKSLSHSVFKILCLWIFTVWFLIYLSIGFFGFFPAGVFGLLEFGCPISFSDREVLKHYFLI